MEIPEKFSGFALVEEDKSVPHGITATIAGDGLIIADYHTHRLKRFSVSGSFDAALGVTALGTIVPWRYPHKIVVEPHRRIYVILERMDALSMGALPLMDERGVLVDNFSRTFQSPIAVTVDPLGKIIVLCQSPTSTLHIENIGQPYYVVTLSIPVVNPVGLVAYNGVIFICDESDGKIKIYTYGGIFLREFELEPKHPFAVRINSSANLVVGSHKLGEAGATLSVYELNGTLLARHPFGTSQGQCLDLDCVGANLVCICSSDGVIQTFEYSNTSVDEDMEESSDPEIPSRSASNSPSESNSQVSSTTE